MDVQEVLIIAVLILFAIALLIFIIRR